MASSCPDELEAMRRLGELVTGLGLSHVVYLLAELADERRDVSLSRPGRRDGDEVGTRWQGARAGRHEPLGIGRDRRLDLRSRCQSSAPTAFSWAQSAATGLR